ncbi:GlxA family transcriptional regulator [Pseudomonas segetis]|uniref:Transcriptional regulator, AraC family with amidase-like domain n=1 Tax=Pseudomonas segetis TaxID=298908 RepID=A0A239JN41_9PSED|nr:GlxA family transcriptional regulator [Pseudomonas segetis]SNT06868.1 transcriptional regulator, AraC family with amidase-like domain [Pseudomonas segetis]
MRSSFESVLKDKNRLHLNGLIDDAREKAVQRVAFLLLDHFSMMAFTGAVDALVTANLMSTAPLYEILVVGSKDLVVSDLGISISVDCSLGDLDERQQSLILVCGGFRVALQAQQGIRTKLRSADSAGVTLGGLWNGSYFIAEAGLLDGYDCAFHPDGRAMMAELFPKVQLSKHSLVLDRNRIGCAGANSSLDMMLEFVKLEHGDSLVHAIEEVLSCDKTKETLDISALTLDNNLTLPQPLKLALELMHNNIEEPLTIDEIVAHVSMSRRQLERLFCRHVNVTPPRYYLELRLTHARQLLQQTNRSLADIAVASGFISISHFRRCFREFFDISPGRFRTGVHKTRGT